MLNILLVVVIVILAILVIAGVYYHAFSKVKLEMRVVEGETLIYESVVGDYKNTGTITNKIYYALLNDDKIETYKGFGIFYDNPKKVEKSQLRSDVGCILEPVDLPKIEELKLSEKYSIKMRDEKEYIVAEFPYKGMLSIILGLIKVYPALNIFAQQNGFDVNSPIMEVYDVPGKRIEYRKEIIKTN